MYKTLCIISLLVCFLNASAQLKSKKPLSALMIDLHNTRPDTGRVLVLLQITNYYLERVPVSENKADSALYFIKAAIKITDTTPYQQWKHEVAHCLAKYYLKKGDYRQGKDILVSILKNVTHDGNKAEELRWLIDIGDHLSLKDTLGVAKLDCYKKIALLYDPVKSREERIKAELDIADIYFLEAKYVSAEQKIFEILTVYAPLETRFLQNAYYYLSQINRYKGNLSTALMYSLKCVKGIEENRDIMGVDYFFGELALVYQELGLVENSIEWYKKALDIRVNNHQAPFVIYRTTGFLVQQLVKQNNEKEASVLIKNIPRENPPVSPFDSAILLQLKANYYNSVRKYDLAEFYYLKMIQSKAIVEEDPEIAFIAYQDIGEFYLLQHQYEKSKLYLTTALKIDPNESVLSRIKDIHLMLYRLDSSMGNFVSAIRHIRQYQILNDSIFNITKSRQIEELKIQYETEKVAQNNKILEKESKLQHSRLLQANLMRNWILAALVVMCIFLALLLYNATIKQRTNRKLEVQQKEIYQKNLTLSHLIEEKEWLVKEIHHRVKNNFHMVVGLLDTQSGYLKNEEALIAIKESQHRIQAMAFIHQKLYQSTNLSSVEMSGYIHELVDYLGHSFNVRQRILFKLDIDNLSLNLSHALPLALILNEAITNSIKYGFPGNRNGIISISLKSESGGHYLLTIADNGVGVSRSFNSKDSHTMGMSLMEGLSEDIYGHFEIKNNQGTLITVHFVYDPSSSNETAPDHSKLSKEVII